MYKKLTVGSKNKTTDQSSRMDYYIFENVVVAKSAIIFTMFKNNKERSIALCNYQYNKTLLFKLYL